MGVWLVHFNLTNLIYLNLFDLINTLIVLFYFIIIMNILDENSKNLELLYKTKNTNLTIYKFFPNLKKLSLKEKSKLLSASLPTLPAPT
mgnify:CR=1 FL=1